MIHQIFKDGAYRLIQRITYSNGKIVERELDTKTLVPLSVTVVKEA
jgi:hypothetical protein